MSEPKPPKTLIQAVRYFEDPEVCVQYIARLRWPDGPVCPACGGTEHSYLKTRYVWKCKACKKQFSVKVGTIFEDSAIPLDKWLAAIWLIANAKNGISSYELARHTGMTQKSAWFVLHRIRLAMQTGNFDKLDGGIEADETFIGGKARNMHKSDKTRRLKGKTGHYGKAAVAGVLQRGGEVRAQVLPGSPSRRLLHRHVREHVAEGATVYTDNLASYSGLTEYGYDHRSVDHAERYVDGRIHTNGMENFWALLKRGLNGTYVSVQPFHLFRYLDERCFTYNERHRDDLGRFELVLQAVAGKRLTWAQLTG